MKALKVAVALIVLLSYAALGLFIVIRAVMFPDPTVAILGFGLVVGGLIVLADRLLKFVAAGPENRHPL